MNMHVHTTVIKFVLLLQDRAKSQILFAGKQPMKLHVSCSQIDNACIFIFSYRHNMTCMMVT